MPVFHKRGSSPSGRQHYRSDPGLLLCRHASPPPRSMDTARGRRSASGHDRCSAGSERRDPLIKSQHKIADFAQNFFKPAAKCVVKNQSVRRIFQSPMRADPISPPSRSRSAPNAQWKALGGSDRDQWNDRLLATTFGVSEGRYLVSGIKQEIRKRTRLLRASLPAMRPLPRATMSRP